jgi:cell division protein FtsQ
MRLLHGARRRIRLRMVLIPIGVLVLLLAGYWFWFRDSSFVSVKTVAVTGESGPDAAGIRSALIIAARNMTTLDVDMGQLRTAVSPYPSVKTLQVATDFPHGLRIHVVEQLPVAVIQLAGRTIAVAGDGTLLRDVQSAPSLPSIGLTVPPGGPRLTDPSALAAVAALAAAPYQLLSRISHVQTAAPHGLVAQLRAGPEVYLGDSSELAQKWSAAVAVLSDSGSAGAAYIDVSDPRRPAAGAGSAAVASANGSGTGSGNGNGSTQSSG